MTPAARAESFLRRRFGPDIAHVAPMRHGEWSRAFAFRHGDGDFIVRFSALDEDFRKDRLAARFATPALPVPAVVEIGEANGGFYAVSERVPGGFLDELDEGGMRATLPALFAAFDAMREANLADTTGYGIWSADGHAPHASWRAALLDVSNDRPGDRIHGWWDRLPASPTGSGPFEQAYGRLTELIGFCPEGRHLIHGDLLNFNVLVEHERISGVIDWGCATYGDFLYDVAWFAMWAPWYPAWRGIDFEEAARRHYAAIGLDVPDFDQRLRCCQIHIGLAAQAYGAFKERWDWVAEEATRTLAVARLGG